MFEQHRQLGDENGDGENDKEVVVRISSLEGHPSLLKEVREKKINSREEKEELVETEDVVHLGNISDKVSTIVISAFPLMVVRVIRIIFPLRIRGERNKRTRC